MAVRMMTFHANRRTVADTFRSDPDRVMIVSICRFVDAALHSIITRAGAIRSG